MCLIVASKRGTLLPLDQLKNAHNNNPHAWGVSWVESSRIECVRGVKWASCTRAIKRAEGHPYVLHFRYATHGRRDMRNAHPFQVRPDLYLAHNGVLNIATPNKELSDTAHLVLHMQSILKDYRDWHHSPDFIPTLESWIGPSNKLALLHVDGRIDLVNQRAGSSLMDDTVWVSNTHSLLPVWEDDDLCWAYFHQSHHTHSVSVINPARVQTRVSSRETVNHNRETVSHQESTPWWQSCCEFCGQYVTRSYVSSGFRVCWKCYQEQMEYLGHHSLDTTEESDNSLFIN